MPEGICFINEEFFSIVTSKDSTMIDQFVITTGMFSLTNGIFFIVKSQAGVGDLRSTNWCKAISNWVVGEMLVVVVLMKLTFGGGGESGRGFVGRGSFFQKRADAQNTFFHISAQI